MTFFQKKKKCQFSPTSRSYIQSFIWISPKLRPAASGQTDKQTDSPKANCETPLIPILVSQYTSGTYNKM